LRTLPIQDVEVHPYVLPTTHWLQAEAEDVRYDPVAAELPVVVEAAACLDEDTSDAVEVELVVLVAEVVEFALSLVMALGPDPPVLGVGMNSDVSPKRILDVPNEVKARDDVVMAWQLHFVAAAVVAAAVVVVVAEHWPYSVDAAVAVVFAVAAVVVGSEQLDAKTLVRLPHSSFDLMVAVVIDA
jgi:hypothetical protein